MKVKVESSTKQPALKKPPSQGKSKDDPIDHCFSSDDEPDGIAATGSGDSKVMFQVSGPDPKFPRRGSDPITMLTLRALCSQGAMIEACVVRAYLSALVCPFYHQGVRCVGTAVWSKWRNTKSWDFVKDLRDGMQSGVDWDTDKLIFVPIFTGSTFSGHFLLLVIDRTQNEDGNFVYFDSLPIPAYGIGTARELAEDLPKLPFWRPRSVFLSMVGRGQAQAKLSNDCGVLTCLYGSAYLLGLQRSKLFEREGLAAGLKTFVIGLEMAAEKHMAKLGRYGRSHIEDTLRVDNVDFTNPALANGLKITLIYDDNN